MRVSISAAYFSAARGFVGVAGLFPGGKTPSHGVRAVEHVANGRFSSESVVVPHAGNDDQGSAAVARGRPHGRHGDSAHTQPV
jgi:hypothetical protein